MNATNISLTSISIISLALAGLSMYHGSKTNEYTNPVSYGVVQKPKEKVVTKKKKKVTAAFYKTDFSLVKTNEKIKLSDRERNCLIMNAFHEAGVEGNMGMVAVVQVVHARQKTEKWGKSFCNVVYAKAQFSWTLEKDKKYKTPKGELWETAKTAVAKYESGYRVAGLGNAMYYHTDYISKPKWAADQHAIGKIGKHIFYTKAQTNDEYQANS